jgi:lipoyl(octanoyl) transferase
MSEAIAANAARVLCRAAWMGEGIDYLEAWELQRRLVIQRAECRIPDMLLLLEHAPVYTAGRRSMPEHVLLNAGGLQALGVPLVETDRGGQVTYHGPGQLIGYPILSLAERVMGPREYVRMLERVLVETVASFELSASTQEGLTGVWIADAKVAAIGVKISRGITLHGFALNVDPDLNYYRNIVACGMPDRGVTSMARLLGRPVEVAEVRRRLVARFAERFGVEVSWVDAEDVLRARPAHSEPLALERSEGFAEEARASR